MDGALFSIHYSQLMKPGRWTRNLQERRERETSARRVLPSTPTGVVQRSAQSRTRKIIRKHSLAPACERGSLSGQRHAVWRAGSILAPHGPNTSPDQFQPQHRQTTAHPCARSENETYLQELQRIQRRGGRLRDAVPKMILHLGGSISFAPTQMRKPNSTAMTLAISWPRSIPSRIRLQAPASMP